MRATHADRLAARRRAKARRLDTFTRLLEDPHGCETLTAIARTMGISQQTASAYFREVRMDLGWQAC